MKEEEKRVRETIVTVILLASLVSAVDAIGWPAFGKPPTVKEVKYTTGNARGEETQYSESSDNGGSEVPQPYELAVWRYWLSKSDVSTTVAWSPTSSRAFRMTGPGLRLSGSAAFNENQILNVIM